MTASVLGSHGSVVEGIYKSRCVHSDIYESFLWNLSKSRPVAKYRE